MEIAMLVVGYLTGRVIISAIKRIQFSHIEW
jgi:hypothetical protein